MAKRPPGVDPETWRAQRDELWGRRNRVSNIVMLAAIAVVLARYFLL